jgi:hypothetical protein
METMPASPSPLVQARTAARLEARLQRDARRLFAADSAALIVEEASAVLDPYWLSLYLVVASHLMARAGRPDAALELVAHMPSTLQQPVARRLGR